MAEKNILSTLEDIKKAFRELEEEGKISHELRSFFNDILRVIEEANLLDVERSLEERTSELEKGLTWLELPVGEVESIINFPEDSDDQETWTAKVRLKGQRPDDECRLTLPTHRELIKAVHEAKKRGGTVWVQFAVEDRKDKKNRLRTMKLVRPTLLVRDILE